MKLKKTLVAGAVLSSLLLAASVQAETLKFTVTGDYTASWTLDSNVVPDESFDGQGFYLYDVVGTFSSSLANLVDLTFFNADLGGGLQIDDFYGQTTLLSTDGPQIYSGTEAAPVFSVGTFALTEYQGTGAYTLTIANVAVPAVPEPATVTMMLAGLGLVGLALRRRKSEAPTEV